MIDFTNCQQRKKAYAGANGSKLSVVYDDALYMLKFPPKPNRNKDMSYANSCVSEYIGCHIFESIGIPVQQTLLGTYTHNDNEKIVVACRDFATDGQVIQDFASLKNQVIDSVQNGYGTDIDDVLSAMEQQNTIEPSHLQAWFWDMFIVDALIGNWDRHNGNWGFLYQPQTDDVTLAPVYDCGSCLYPQMDETLMAKVMESEEELAFRVYEIPLSGLTQNGKKLRYFDFLSSLQYEGCNQALKRILPRIDMDMIAQIIQQTPYITPLQKEFYMLILQTRKERMLDFSLQKLLEFEQIPAPSKTKGAKHREAR